jgi:hypothetical protein
MSLRRPDRTRVRKVERLPLPRRLLDAAYRARPAHARLGADHRADRARGPHAQGRRTARAQGLEHSAVSDHSERAERLRAEIVRCARAVAKEFPQEPAWTAWLERWIAGDDREGKTVAEQAAWLDTLCARVREAPCVEGQVVGTDENLSRRMAHIDASLLALDDARLLEHEAELHESIIETDRRIARIRRERSAPRPRLWGG